MTADLQTIRDFLRYAVTAFSRGGVHFGHGAGTALDEAAFLILESLSLPIDDINPWLDARLTLSERDRLLSLIEARVTTRKPAAYLLNKAYVQGVPFYVDERVIVPRSYIGEILAAEPAFLPAPTDVRSILDLCTGAGCLAILAALAYPDAEVHAADLSADALEVAERNVADHGLEDRITLHRGDLFAPLGERRFDLILTNPPYVDAAAMAALPPEFRAEPRLALAGGDDGLDIVRRILAEAPAHLNAGGGVLCEFGTGRDILEEEYPHLDFLWPSSEEGDGEVFWLTRESFGA
ncbi:MAG: 50S ribosomal protein L3 N(5)-glutamine methyltransferase [Parvularculaceae bacterium]